MACAGCGYSSSRPFPNNVSEALYGSGELDASATTTQPVRGRIRTVYVEPFRSREFRREIEMRLTEAVQKRIEMDTGYRIAKKRRADTVLTGEILEVRQSTFGNDFVFDRPRELATTFVMRMRWTHAATGTILMERRVATQTETWVPLAGETFFKGSDRVIDKLAVAIVRQMETPW